MRGYNSIAPCREKALTSLLQNKDEMSVIKDTYWGPHDSILCRLHILCCFICNAMLSINPTYIYINVIKLYIIAGKQHVFSFFFSSHLHFCLISISHTHTHTHTPTHLNTHTLDHMHIHTSALTHRHTQTNPHTSWGHLPASAW